MLEAEEEVAAPSAVSQSGGYCSDGVGSVLVVSEIVENFAL